MSGPSSSKKRNFFEAFTSKAKKPAIASPSLEASRPPGKKLARESSLDLNLSSKPNCPKTPERNLKSLIGSPKNQYAVEQGNKEAEANDGEEEESTDFKLALLSSLQPELTPEILLELLLTCNGSVKEASQLASSRTSSPSKRQATAITTQSSLATYLANPSADSASVDALTRPIPFPLSPIAKFQTVHLTTPSQVPYYAPATLQPSFLPSNLVNKLLQECLDEVPSFGKYEFRLFERNVSSPHTAAFYVKNEEIAVKHRNSYMYNGSYLDDIRTFTPTMLEVIPLIETHVNNSINSRISNVYPDGKKLKYMLPSGGWRITSAFMNCYDGAKQSVGWHSDQLTYLGPRTVIASLSLGVEREFRLRRVSPVVLDPEDPEEELSAGKIDADGKWKWEPEGQLSLHLPHNSLLIMHAECQESYKHSVHPANNIQPHPIAKGKRINITFRCYRESFSPDKIPKCKCGVGCVLKTVQRVKDKMGWYFWGCQVGNQWKDEEDDGTKKDEKKEGGCGYIIWARFTEDGDPIWD